MLRLTAAALSLLAVAGPIAAVTDVSAEPGVYTIEFDISHARGVRASSQRPAVGKQGRWSNQNEHRRYRQEKLDSLSSSSLAIEGCFQTDFYANVNIGNSTFQLILDTGSTTMAVAGTSCQETDSSGQNPVEACGVDEYTPTGNSVGSVKANYGIGSLQGPIYNGDVTVGSTPTVNMDFVVVTASTDFFTDDSCTGNNVQAPVYDGILGLAYSKLAYQGTDSWFDKLLSTTSAALANQAFTMSFTESSGVMNIGTGSSDDSQTRYMAVTPTGYYSGLATKISVGGSAVSGVTQSAIGGFVVDSGTNSIVLPTNVYRAVVNAIVTSPGWQQSGLSTRFFSNSNCATPKNANTINNILPELTVTMVTPQNTLIDVTIQAYNGYITPFNSTPTTELWCSGLADGGAVDSSSESNAILGLPFMIQFETTFDRANSRVGFNPTQCADCQTGNTTGYSGSFTPYSQTPAGNAGSQLASPVVAALLSIIACIVITQAHWTG